MKYFVGIDNGGTTTKAAVYDENGSEMAVASMSTEAICERLGFVERDMTDMWQTNCQVIRSALAKSAVDPRQIAGVACCGHGKGLYLIDRGGRPVRRAILSADTRAEAYVQKWKKDGTEQRAYALSLQHTMACQPTALLAWLRDNEPQVIGSIGKLLPCKDYIRYRLTGQAMGEMSDMSGTGLLNLKTGRYDRALLDIFGIAFIESALPPLCKSSDLCGTVQEEAAALTGLPVGTPVYGGMFDIDACALAVGAVSPRELCMISGTWSINEFVSDAPVISDAVQMNSLFCLDDKYLIEESSATSAGNNEWFLKKVLRLKTTDSKSIYEIANHEAASLRPGEPIPIFFPFVMASNVNPNAMGAFIGLSESMERKHLIRSVYEGVVFSHRWHLERLLMSRTEPVTVILLAGGATRSPVWVQMFADILGYPIQSVVTNETGTLGCAILAAAASGAKSSIGEAVHDMVRYCEPVPPNPANKPRYDDRYRQYCQLLQCLDPIWADLRKTLG